MVGEDGRACRMVDPSRCVGTAVAVVLIYVVLSMQEVANLYNDNSFRMEQILHKQIWVPPCMQANGSGLVPLVPSVLTPSLSDSESGPGPGPGPRSSSLRKYVAIQKVEEEVSLEEWAEGNVNYRHICGRQWTRHYADLHNRVLSRQSEKQRFLIFRPHLRGGIGDRLVGLVTLFVNALLTQRAFIIDWEGLDEVFEPNEIDWRFSAAMFPKTVLHNFTKQGQTFWAKDHLEGSAEILAMTEEIALLHAVARGGVPSTSWFQSRTEAHDTVIAKTNRGSLLTYFLEPKSGKLLTGMGLYPPFAFGCILRYLFRPSRKLLAAVQTTTGVKLMNPSNFRVGVHVRVGDFSFGSHQVNPKDRAVADVLFQCAKRITDYWAPPGQNVVWFFITDSPPLKTAIKDAYGDKVAISDVAPAHIIIVDGDKRRDEDGHGHGHATLFNAFVEWYMFSLNDFFVYTESGLTKTAAFYSLHQMATFQFQRHISSNTSLELDTSCDPTNPKGAFAFRSWSGL